MSSQDFGTSERGVVETGVGDHPRPLCTVSKDEIRYEMRASVKLKSQRHEVRASGRSSD